MTDVTEIANMAMLSVAWLAILLPPRPFTNGLKLGVGLMTLAWFGISAGLGVTLSARIDPSLAHSLLAGTRSAWMAVMFGGGLVLLISGVRASRKQREQRAA